MPEITEEQLIRSLQALREAPYSEAEAEEARQRFSAMQERLRHDPVLQARIERLCAEAAAETEAHVQEFIALREQVQRDPAVLASLDRAIAEADAQLGAASGTVGDASQGST